MAGIFAWSGLQEAPVIVEWDTASELDIAGYNVYRSTSHSGPFEKVNSQLIPASQDPLAGGSYRYTDELVAADQLYYYELEAIETTGGSERFGPIEVRSKRGGTIELALAILMAAAGVLLILIPRRSVSRDG